jgi:hypothetical protein
MFKSEKQAYNSHKLYISPSHAAGKKDYSQYYPSAC